MKKIRFIFMLIPIIFIQSCKYAFHEAVWRNNPVDSRTTDIIKVELSEKNITIPASKKYDVILIADPHFGHDKYDAPQEVFFKWLKQYLAKNEKPLFCITLGDLVDHGTGSEYKTFAAFQKKLVATYTIPVYNILGNHDVYNSGYGLWKKTCYPHTPAYYFETNAFQWYFLDTASGTLGRPQFQALEKKLNDNPDTPKLVFTHYPLYGDGIFYFALCNPRERAELISLFGKTNVKLYCAGHYHKGCYYDFGCFKEHVLKAFGQYGGWYVMHVDESNANNPVFETEKCNPLTQ